MGYIPINCFSFFDIQSLEIFRILWNQVMQSLSSGANCFEKETGSGKRKNLHIAPPIDSIVSNVYGEIIIYTSYIYI
jgi:hypothetical protein